MFPSLPDVASNSRVVTENREVTRSGDKAIPKGILVAGLTSSDLGDKEPSRDERTSAMYGPLTCQIRVP